MRRTKRQESGETVYLIKFLFLDYSSVCRRNHFLWLNLHHHSSKKETQEEVLPEKEPIRIKCFLIGRIPESFPVGGANGSQSICKQEAEKRLFYPTGGEQSRLFFFFQNSPERTILLSLTGGVGRLDFAFAFSWPEFPAEELVLFPAAVKQDSWFLWQHRWSDGLKMIQQCCLS